MAGKRASPALLDVNVLVALAWPNHVHHPAARGWFAANHRAGWATTPVTECGFVRVSSDRAAVPTATTPALAVELLRRITRQPGHVFWSDAVPLAVGEVVASERVQTHRDVTDAHLVALALGYGGRVVSFDAGLRRLIDASSPVLEILEGVHDG